MPYTHHADRIITTQGKHHAEGTPRRRHITPIGTSRRKAQKKPRKSGAFLTDYYFYYLLFLMKSLSFLVSIFQ